MINPTTVYIPVPVSEKPDKDGKYMCFYQDGVGTFAYIREDGWIKGMCTLTAWLKPIVLTEESPVQKVIEGLKSHAEHFNHPMESGVVSALLSHLEFVLPHCVARSAYIKELEDKVTKLQERNDDMTVSLEKEIANSKQWCSKAMEAANQRLQLQNEITQLKAELLTYQSLKQ